MRLKKIILGSLIGAVGLVSLASCDLFNNNNNKTENTKTETVDSYDANVDKPEDKTETKIETKTDTKKEYTEAEIKELALKANESEIKSAISLLKEYSNNLLKDYKELDASKEKAQDDDIKKINTSLTALETKISDIDNSIKALEEKLTSSLESKRTRYTCLEDINNGKTNCYEMYYHFGLEEARGISPKTDTSSNEYSQGNLTKEEIKKYYLKNASFKFIEFDGGCWIDEEYNYTYYDRYYNGFVDCFETEDGYDFYYFYLESNGTIREIKQNEFSNWVLVVVPNC